MKRIIFNKLHFLLVLFLIYILTIGITEAKLLNIDKSLYQASEYEREANYNQAIGQYEEVLRHLKQDKIKVSQNTKDILQITHRIVRNYVLCREYSKALEKLQQELNYVGASTSAISTQLERLKQEIEARQSLNPEELAALDLVTRWELAYESKNIDALREYAVPYSKSYVQLNNPEVTDKLKKMNSIEIEFWNFDVSIHNNEAIVFCNAKVTMIYKRKVDEQIGENAFKLIREGGKWKILSI